MMRTVRNKQTNEAATTSKKNKKQNKTKKTRKYLYKVMTGSAVE